MQSSIRTVAVIALFAGSALAAQTPGSAGGDFQGRRAPAAKLLLSNTAELDLTDAQVVKLAAIARRSEARRRAMRTSLDSARARFGQPTAGDSVARRQFRDRMRTDMARVRDQAQADQRDAIAVLTPDQQARAWDLVSNRGRAMSRGMRSGGMGRGAVRRNGAMGPRRRNERGFGPQGARPDMPRPARPPRPPVE